MGFFYEFLFANVGLIYGFLLLQMDFNKWIKKGVPFMTSDHYDSSVAKLLDSDIQVCVCVCVFVCVCVCVCVFVCERDRQRKRKKGIVRERRRETARERESVSLCVCVCVCVCVCASIVNYESAILFFCCQIVGL